MQGIIFYMTAFSVSVHTERIWLFWEMGSYCAEIVVCRIKCTADASIDFKQLLCGLRETLSPYSNLSSNPSPAPHCRYAWILDTIPVIREHVCVHWHSLPCSTDQRATFNRLLTSFHSRSWTRAPAAINTLHRASLKITLLVFFQSRSEAGSEPRENEEAAAALSCFR